MKKSLLGVDIGANSVKVVEVRWKGATPVVVSAGFREIDIRRRDGLPEREATLTTLKDLLAESGIKTKEAAVLLHGPSTAVLRLHLPRMPERELHRAVRWEASKHVSFPLDDVIFRQQILGEVVDRDGLPKLAVLAAVVERRFALERASLVKEAGLIPIGMTISPFALWQLLKESDGNAEQLTVLLDVGAEVSTIAFFLKGNLEFTREIATAGAAITEALTGAVITDRGRVQLDIYQAEKLKRSYGFPEEDRPLEEGITLGQLRAMMRPALERLALEVQRSFSYYVERFGETPTGKVLLSGGTASLKNLAPFLGQRLGIQVELLNPFASLLLSSPLSRESLSEGAPRLAIATGLALERTGGLNLLPPSLALEQRVKKVKAAGRILLVVLGVLLAFVYAVERMRVSFYQQALKQRQETILNLKPLLETMRQLQEEETKLTPKLEAYDALVRHRIPWPGLLKELSRLTPETIVLEELISMRPSGEPTPEPDGRLKLKGLSLVEAGEAEASLALYLSALSRSPFFKEVNLMTVSEREGHMTRALEFEITLAIK